LISCISRRIESEVGCDEFCSNESTFVTDDLAQCRCCVSLVTRCAFDVHLAVGTTRRPTKHGFSGIPVRFLSLMWEKRASLERTLSLFGTHNHWNCGPILTWERGNLVQSWNHVFSIRIFAKNVFSRFLFKFSRVLRLSQNAARTGSPFKEKSEKKPEDDTPSTRKKTRKDLGQRDPPWRTMY